MFPMDAAKRTATVNTANRGFSHLAELRPAPIGPGFRTVTAVFVEGKLGVG